MSFPTNLLRNSAFQAWCFFCSGLRKESGYLEADVSTALFGKPNVPNVPQCGHRNSKGPNNMETRRLHKSEKRALLVRLRKRAVDWLDPKL